MPPPIVVATTGWPLLADFLRRPLRRCRETVLIYGRLRLRGTAALHAVNDHRCHKWMGGLNPARQLFQNPVHSQLRQLFH
jgi:hypothetical protein